MDLFLFMQFTLNEYLRLSGSLFNWKYFTILMFLPYTYIAQINAVLVSIGDIFQRHINTHTY